jgi:sec-independent protein translocase protein TatB
MFNLDPGKLLVIAVVAIILLGPDRLPQVARQIGGAWRTFNEFRHRMESEVRSTMPDLPPTSEIARLARSPSALLNHLSTLSSDDDEEEPDGSFQPPVGTNGNAAPDMNGATAGKAYAGSTDMGVPDAATGVSSEPAPPPHWVPPAPAPPEVIVPGDPTLN